MLLHFQRARYFFRLLSTLKPDLQLGVFEELKRLNRWMRSAVFAVAALRILARPHDVAVDPGSMRLYHAQTKFK